MRSLIAGCILITFGFAVTFLGKDVSTAVLIVVALGAVIVAFPDVIELKVTATGVSIKRQSERKETVGNLAVFALQPLRVPHWLQLNPALLHGVRCVSIAFFFGTLSGTVTSIVSSFTGDMQIDNISFLGIPKAAPIIYTLFLTLYLYVVMNIRLKYSIIVLFVWIYCSWFAAISTIIYAYNFVQVFKLPQLMTGISAGAVGAGFVSIVLAILLPPLRRAAAFVTFVFLGGASGIFIVYDILGSAKLSETLHNLLAFYPVFIIWHGTNLAAIGYYLNSNRNPGQ